MIITTQNNGFLRIVGVDISGLRIIGFDNIGFRSPIFFENVGSRIEPAQIFLNPFLKIPANSLA